MTINLRKLRIDRGLGLEEAADQMGVHRDTLARAETGDGKPHPRNALKIAAFYGFKPSEVWPLDDPKVAA